MKTHKPWVAPLLSLIFFGLFIGAWYLATMKVNAPVVVESEYAKLVGASAATGTKSAVPNPTDVAQKLWQHIKDPFYDRGTNDKGIGIQLGYSIGRVLLGFFLATDATRLMKEVGLTPPTTSSKKFFVMKKEFDPSKPEQYLKSFAIRKS